MDEEFSSRPDIFGFKKKEKKERKIRMFRLTKENQTEGEG